MRIRKILSYLINFVTRSNLIFKVFQLVVDELHKKTNIVEHKNHKMIFSVPNYLASYRCQTFSTKEPDTLTWIEQMEDSSVFWDIGANVGLYSIYCAKYNKSKVYSFEPSVFNLELLARNININDLQNLITIVPIALTNRIGIQKFKMNNFTWGSALSTFGEDFDQFGNDIGVPKFEYSLPGVSMDDVSTHFNIDLPDYIKIDVDGIEHLILEGGSEVLKSVTSILLEVNDNFPEQSNAINKRLTESGFSLFKKCDLGDEFFFNQWWVKQGENE